jgi:chloramphenicol-sensitive protein RarD
VSFDARAGSPKVPALSSPAHTSSTVRGVIAAFACYLVWGLVPLFWKELASVDALELIAHRHVWSLVFLAGVLTWLGGWTEARQALRTPRDFAVNALGGVLLTINWLIYVWAVNRGHVIECSLGYFLVPLLNVTLGRLVLHETLRPLQKVAVGAAAAGVGVLVWRLGHLPWIALGLATSFGFYGLLRKRSPLGPLTGLAVETALLAPLAGGWLLWKAVHGAGALGHSDARITGLVLSTGVITAIPLLLFAYGARRLRLTTLGLLQYTAPTCQFLLGWWVYHEPFSRDRAWAFALIWCGLACYTGDAWLAQRRQSTA